MIHGAHASGVVRDAALPRCGPRLRRGAAGPSARCGSLHPAKRGRAPSQRLGFAPHRAKRDFYINDIASISAAARLPDSTAPFM
jgi:hypothetical protein